MAQPRFIRRLHKMGIDDANSASSNRTSMGEMYQNLVLASFSVSAESHGQVLPGGGLGATLRRILTGLHPRELAKLAEHSRHLLQCLLLTIFSVAVPAVALAEQNGSSVTGALLYHTHCASCHGDQARGNGMVGKALRTPPTDLTLLAHRNNGVFPDARVSDYIEGVRDVTAHGPRTMPVWGMIFDNKETIRKIVDYLKELQRS